MLLVLGLTAPRLLKYPSAVWWKFAMILGYVNARIILTIAFLLVLTPISLVWRLIGRDPLAIKKAALARLVTVSCALPRQGSFLTMY